MNEKEIKRRIKNKVIGHGIEDLKGRSYKLSLVTEALEELNYEMVSQENTNNGDFIVGFKDKLDKLIWYIKWVRDLDTEQLRTINDVYKKEIDSELKATMTINIVPLINEENANKEFMDDNLSNFKYYVEEIARRYSLTANVEIDRKY